MHHPFQRVAPITLKPILGVVAPRHSHGHNCQAWSEPHPHNIRKLCKPIHPLLQTIIWSPWQFHLQYVAVQSSSDIVSSFFTKNNLSNRISSTKSILLSFKQYLKWMESKWFWLTFRLFFFYKSHLGNAIFLSRFQTNPPTFSASCTIRQQCVSSAVHFKGGQVMALRMMGNPNWHDPKMMTFTMGIQVGDVLKWWVFPPNHPILIGFSNINHPFWGTPISFQPNGGFLTWWVSPTPTMGFSY